MSSRLLQALLFALAIAAGVSACDGPPSVTEQVKAAIAELEELGEAGERSAFLERLTEDFQGQGGPGNVFSRDEFGTFLALQWSQHRRISAQLFPIEVTELGPGLATAKFRVLLTGGAGLIPDSGQMYAVETSWQLEDGDWLLWRCSWTSTGL